MTIHHPRVGFEIVSVTAGGTSDPNDATPVPINVGETLIFGFPAAGWTNSGQPPGGIMIVGEADVGNRVSLRPGDVLRHAFGVRVYLPPGDSLYNSAGRATNFTIGDLTSGGDLMRVTKVNATEWIVG
jgi:hypothetical protein